MPVNQRVKLGGGVLAGGVISGDSLSEITGCNGAGFVSKCAGGCGQGEPQSGGIMEEPHPVRTRTSNSASIVFMVVLQFSYFPLFLRKLRREGIASFDFGLMVSLRLP